MNLLSIQKGFRDHILAGADASLSSVKLAGMQGLAVYRHAYRAQLMACLRDTYEKTWSWLGDAAFDACARAYVETAPPSTWTLNEYGSGFSDALKQSYPEDPEVSELAWLDWTLRRAFDGPNGTPITSAELASVNWNNAVRYFLPTLTVGTVTSNAPAMWSALSEGAMPPPAERLPLVGAVRVWRANLSPKFRSIEDFERRALLLALAGTKFADLCALLVENDDLDVAAQRVGSLLASWIQDQLIMFVRPALDH